MNRHLGRYSSQLDFQRVRPQALSPGSSKRRTILNTFSFQNQRHAIPRAYQRPWLVRADYLTGRAGRRNCPILVAVILAEVVLFLHLLWCAWVLLGWTITRGRRFLRTLHIASLIYAIVIELLPWPVCPLTIAETWLETRADIEPARRPFVARVLDAVAYPGLPEWLVVSGAVLVCAATLSIYLWRYLHRPADGPW
jgi:hypothetical protein